MSFHVLHSPEVLVLIVRYLQIPDIAIFARADGELTTPLRWQKSQEREEREEGGGEQAGGAGGGRRRRAVKYARGKC